MDKEIIIDDVDVAGCEHLKNDGIKKPICRSGGCRGVYKSCLCQGNTDCHYKQLKRLQQDYVRLSQTFEHLKTSYQENQEYFLELKAENERLKEELKNNELDYQLELNTYNIEGGNLLEENKQLQQTLQEIKEVLCQGRTFYDGYFDNPENLSRIDKAIYLITKAEEE